MSCFFVSDDLGFSVAAIRMVFTKAIYESRIYDFLVEDTLRASFYLTELAFFFFGHPMGRHKYFIPVA